jgi:hypothetical protein
VVVKIFGLWKEKDHDGLVEVACDVAGSSTRKGKVSLCQIWLLQDLVSGNLHNTLFTIYCAKVTFKEHFSTAVARIAYI